MNARGLDADVQPDREPPRLSARELTKFFGLRRGAFRRPLLVRAVCDVTLWVGAGETVGIIGESGSGKTTLGRLLARLLDPSHGRVCFEGQDITERSERELGSVRRQLQMVFQDASSSLDPRLTVHELVAQPLRIHELTPRGPAERDRVRMLLARVGAGPIPLDSRASELSSGQCQRVSLARAFALEPKLLICDEPFAALDAAEQRELVALLESRAGVGAADASYVFISHDVPTTLATSQRVYVMHGGRIVEHAGASTLRQRSGHPYTRALLHAAAEVHPRQRRLRLAWDGTPASPFRPHAGCDFRERCPRASRRCESLPPLSQLEAGHWVSCWHPHT